MSRFLFFIMFIALCSGHSAAGQEQLPAPKTKTVQEKQGANGQPTQDPNIKPAGNQTTTATPSPGETIQPARVGRNARYVPVYQTYSGYFVDPYSYVPARNYYNNDMYSYGNRTSAIGRTVDQNLDYNYRPLNDYEIPQLSEAPRIRVNAYKNETLRRYNLPPDPIVDRDGFIDTNTQRIMLSRQQSFRTSRRPLESAQTSAKRVIMEIHLPSPNAVVKVEGVVINGTGKDRQFVSPPLPLYGKYSYTLQASWTENGVQHNQTQTLLVQPGDRMTVAFSKE